MTISTNTATSGSANFQVQCELPPVGSVDRTEKPRASTATRSELDTHDAP
jgi:hypothetical protein